MTYTGRQVTQFRLLVAATYGLTCHLCGQPIRNLQEMETDHLVPRSRGGDPYDLANARPAHGTKSREKCNQRRGNQPLGSTTNTSSDSDNTAWFTTTRTTNTTQEQEAST